MKKISSRFLLLILPSLCFFAGGCFSTASLPETPTATNGKSGGASCSYFHFLKGRHAEFALRFEEALGAYEEALLCDPEAEYIREKIPALLIRLEKFEEAAALLQERLALAEDSEKTSLRLLLARLKVQAGADQEAVDLYREALEYDPENRDIRLQLGLLHLRREEFSRAREIFQRLLKNDPQFYPAALSLARLFSRTGDFEKAGKFYEQALALQWSRKLIYETADFYNLHKRYGKELQLYDSLLEQNGRDRRAALGAIQSLFHLEEYDEALRRLYAFQKRSPEPHMADSIICHILIRQGAYAEAEERLRTLVESHPSSEAYLLLSTALFEGKKPEKALETLQHIAPESEEYVHGVRLRTKILKDAQRSEEAATLLKRDIARRESGKPVFYSWLASLHQDSGDMETALETLAGGIGTFPNNEGLYFDYGVLLEISGAQEKAISIMQKLLTLNPQHSGALNFVGYIWADNNQNLHQALEYIQRAVLLRPENGYIRDSLGWVYFRLGAFEKARAELEKALALQPEDPHMHEHLGDIYSAAGNRKKALENYRKALEIFTEDEKKKTVQEKIDAFPKI